MVGLHGCQGVVENLLLGQEGLVSSDASLEVGKEEGLQFGFTVLPLLLEHLDAAGQHGDKALRLGFRSRLGPGNLLNGLRLGRRRQSQQRETRRGSLVWAQHLQVLCLAIICLLDGLIQELLCSQELVLEHLQLAVSKRIALLHGLGVVQHLLIRLLHVHDLLCKQSILLDHLQIRLLLLLQFSVEDSLLTLHACSVFLLHLQHLLLQFLRLRADAA
mmetsp:Transcript_26693/g.50152  ORF Transcript_26693/g.50152 Transcript_26693/m.50152 type:complete len:217 (-) Transcript_26693:260-910(-)